MPSLKDLILSALDKKVKPISIPEWNVECFIRQWSAKERNEFLASIASVSSGDSAKLFSQNMDAKAVVLSLADKDGNRLLDDRSIDAILEKNGENVSRVGQECMRYNGIGNDDIKNV